ncbi:galactosyltransferase-related protein [Streptosporangium sp. NPDC050855]|uniref:galactosyltransferase-related protein n=1 Tax=Streptosporangium sp. NPDC050855 TaxID=3366194 RepID=UPI0037B5B404
MRVAVVIPWRGGQPDRERHHETVRAHLRTLLPDAWHIDADSGHTPFSRAGSRNHGVRLAQDVGADVVVLCDADTLPEREPLLAAVESAHDGLLHLPYTHFRGLSPQGTDAYLAGTPAYLCATELETDWSTGGILVIQPSAWWQAGGMDERFQGWGAEDTAARVACDALLGPTAKHEGTIFHLWHPSEIDPSSLLYQANMALMGRYVEAEGDPEAVRPLVAEHNPSVLASSAHP